MNNIANLIEELIFIRDIRCESLEEQDSVALACNILQMLDDKKNKDLTVAELLEKIRG